MDLNSLNLPLEKFEAVRAFLAEKVNIPGRIRLYATGFEEYGPTLLGLAKCAHPLIFDTDIEGAEYGIAGTCFLATYRGRLFVLTAGHCLTEGNGNDLRIALNPKTKAFLPIKQLNRAKSNPPDQDYADVAILEAEPSLLTAEEQRDLVTLDLDQLFAAEMTLQQNAKLVVAGFPKCLNGVDYENFVLKMQAYMPSGRYLRASEKIGIHLLQLNEAEQVTQGDGMSGSPVLFVEEYAGGHCFGFLGMSIKGSDFWLQKEFIGADVLFQMLDKIIQEKDSKS